MGTMIPKQCTVCHNMVENPCGGIAEAGIKNCPGIAVSMSSMRTFDTGATRDTTEGKLQYKGFLSPSVLKRFAEYMDEHRVQADGEKRDADNWKRGIPTDAYEDSLLRHTIQDFWIGIEEGDYDRAEEAACAIMFNVQGWLHETLKLKESYGE